jgi:hypothetical protein
MDPRPVKENTARVLLVALAFFGALALLGWADGVFARLGMALVAALAGFAAVFAAATYALDVEVRRYVRGLLGLTKAPAKSPAAKRVAT